MKDRQPITNDQQAIMIAFAQQNPNGVSLKDLTNLIGHSRQATQYRYNSLRKTHPELGLPPTLGHSPAARRRSAEHNGRVNEASKLVDEEIVNKRILENKLPQEIADELALSVRQTRRRMTRLRQEGLIPSQRSSRPRGITPEVQSRIDEAKALKESHPELSLRKIAQMLGVEFSNLRHYVKYGESPAATQRRKRRDATKNAQTQ